MSTTCSFICYLYIHGSGLKISWDRVHVDYAGPIGFYDISLIDAYSKWIEAHVMSLSISEVTIEHLSQIFATHGLPKSIVSENGSCFTSLANS